MSYRLSGLGQDGLPLSAQQRLKPGASSPLIAPETRISAIQRAATSIVPPGCSTVDMLSTMRAWQRPPTTVPVRGALVFGIRLPAGTSTRTGEQFAANVARLRGVWIAPTLWERDSGYLPSERIAWIAIRLTRQPEVVTTTTIGGRGAITNSDMINRIVTGAFQGWLRKPRSEGGMGTSLVGVVPMMYLPPDRDPPSQSMRHGVYQIMAWRSAKTWDEFRVALAVGIFGRMNLSTNVRRRTPDTGFSTLQTGVEAATNAASVAAEGISIAEAAIGHAETGDAGPAAQAIRAGRKHINDALAKIDAGLAAGPRVAANAQRAQEQVSAFVPAAVEATTPRIREADPKLRKYMECKLWEFANDQAERLRATFRLQRDRAPSLLGELQANADRARGIYRNALAQIDNVEKRVNDILGPLLTRRYGGLPLWAWGAIGTTAFLGTAVMLRRARKKRLGKNRRRRTTYRRAA